MIRPRPALAFLSATIALTLGAAPTPTRADAGGTTRLIVGTEPTLSPAEEAEVPAAAGAEVTARLPDIDAQVLSVPSGEADEAIAELRAQPGVTWVETDDPVYATQAPNDPLFDRQWALSNTGQTGTAGVDVDAQAAWTLATGAGVTVAVADSGVMNTHPDLAGQVAGGDFDFVDRDFDASDVTGHGTHVAGVIAARQSDGVGVTGLAPAAKILSLRVIDENSRGSDSYIASAFSYAGRAGVRVVNASFRGRTPSPAVEAAIRAYPETLFVVAAGNDRGSLDAVASYPCEFPQPNVICVGASDEHDRGASFSNYGSAVDIVAPGTNILSDRYAAGGATYAEASGTSMAAPHVAATIALMLSRNPGLTAAQVRAMLLTGAEQPPQLAGRSESGARLNAYGALTGAPPETPTTVPSPVVPPSPAPTTVPAPATPPARASIDRLRLSGSCKATRTAKPCAVMLLYRARGATALVIDVQRRCGDKRRCTWRRATRTTLPVRASPSAATPTVSSSGTLFLAPGHYRLRVRATNASGRSGPLLRRVTLRAKLGQ